MNVRSPQPYGRIFRWPLWLAGGIVVGLVSGLLGEGGFDLIAWIGLGVPLLVCAWAAWRRS